MCTNPSLVYTVWEMGFGWECMNPVCGKYWHNINPLLVNIWERNIPYLGHAWECKNPILGKYWHAINPLLGNICNRIISYLGFEWKCNNPILGKHWLNLNPLLVYIWDTKIPCLGYGFSQFHPIKNLIISLFNPKMWNLEFFLCIFRNCCDIRNWGQLTSNCRRKLHLLTLPPLFSSIE